MQRSQYKGERSSCWVTNYPPTHLPVGEEDDALDGEELQHRVVRSEKVLRGKVEEEEGVESHRDAAKDLLSYMIIFIIWSSSKLRRHGAK